MLYCEGGSPPKLFPQPLSSSTAARLPSSFPLDAVFITLPLAMALKRKFSDEFDDVAPIVRHMHIAYSHVTRLTLDVQNGKQQKLIPFPNSSELDSDVAMSDASISDLEPLTIPAHHFHTRLPSDVSYASSSTSDSPHSSRKYPTYVQRVLTSCFNLCMVCSAFYPVFDLYPTDSDSYMVVSAHGLPDPTLYASQKSVGLMQPKGNNFTHHG